MLFVIISLAHAETLIPLSSMKPGRLGPATTVITHPVTVVFHTSTASASGPPPSEPMDVVNDRPLVSSADQDALKPATGRSDQVKKKAPRKIINPTTEELFGSSPSIFHPYLTLREEYTSNVYNIAMDEVGSLNTTLSSGLWLSLPRRSRLPVSLSPYNASVAGMRYSVPGSGPFERFQSYLKAGVFYNSYSANSDLNNTAWHLEGMYQQNLAAGISFRVMDRYTRDRDRLDIGSFIREDFRVGNGAIAVVSTPSLIRPYASNQLVLSTNIHPGERFSALFTFINFYLDYENQVDAWLDRIDNSLGLKLSYTYSPKTSFFLEYDHASVRYGTTTDNDSQNNYYLGGIDWRASEKISLMARGGYQLKRYDANLAEAESDDPNTMYLETRLNYLITDKTKISIRMYNALEEADTFGSRGRDTLAGDLRYDQQFTYRIQGFVEAGYDTSDYNGYSSVESSTILHEARRDRRYQLRPGLQYTFRDWLVAELSYSYEHRNSNDDFFDFSTHSVFFSLNSAF